MRSFVILALSFVVLKAQAVDTSGCGSLAQERKSLQTSHNLTLTAVTSKSPYQNCWNRQNSFVRLNYEWRQATAPDSTPKILFWVNLNGREETLRAETYCQEQNANHMQADTSGRTLYHCIATATLAIDASKAIDLEVAPQVNGTWDTSGYRQNYRFKF